MRLPVADYFLLRLRLHPNGDLVGHGARRAEQTCLQPKQGGGLLFQGAHGRVFSEHVVAHVGVHHGGVHGRGGFGHRIAA